MRTPRSAASLHTDSRPAGSPAWKPHATLALVTMPSMASSSPSRQTPNPSPKSALRSMQATVVSLSADVGRSPPTLPKTSSDAAIPAISVQNSVIRAVPATSSRAPAARAGVIACWGRCSQPKWSITTEVIKLALTANAAKGPAPTRSTNNNPATTANAPTIPPSGAHHGIAEIPSAVGSGRGKTAVMTTNTAAMRPNETSDANHGLTNELRSTAFIGMPIACNAPAAAINGNTQNTLTDCMWDSLPEEFP